MLSCIFACPYSFVNERFLMMAAVDCPSLGRVKGQWYKAVPPLVRCHTGLTPADYFGRTLVERLPDNIKVGVINVAVGGCRIELFDEENCEEHIASQPEWLKNTAKAYSNNPYRRLKELAVEAQKVGVIKGRGVNPALAIVRCGERPDDLSYEKGATKRPFIVQR